MRNMGDRQDKNCTSLSLADARPFAGGQSDAEFLRSYQSVLAATDLANK